MNSENYNTAEKMTDARLRAFLKEGRRVPQENPWLERRVMAALPDKKQRRGTALHIAPYLGAALLIIGGWVSGGLWFLSNEPSLTSIAVLCSIPLMTIFSGAVVAAPALKKLFS